MILTLRIIGTLLLLLGALNLGSIAYLFITDNMDTLRSPASLGLRYGLMFLAGIGYVLLRKWGVVLFVTSVTLNWLVYLTVYGGEGSLIPLWVGVVMPMAIVVLSYAAWDKLR